MAQFEKKFCRGGPPPARGFAPPPRRPSMHPLLAVLIENVQILTTSLLIPFE